MPNADVIFTNANIITVDPKQPMAQMVAVKDGKILFVVSNDRTGFQGYRTKVIDCGGKTLVPGFNDAHCHIFSFVRKLLSLDLGTPDIKSIADIKAAIKKKTENTPPGEWISGSDYNDFALSEKRHPTRWEMDEVAPNNPVVLSHRGLHACVLNSKALALAHITIESPEPPGAFISRDVNTGEPDGLLVEMLPFIREKVMPPVSDEELNKGIKIASEQYLAWGLTSLQDATFVNDLKRWRRYEHLIAAGLMKNRVTMMAGAGTIAEFQMAGLEYGSGDSRLRLGGMKIVPSLISGILHPPQEELNGQVLDAHRAGFQVGIHAVQEKLIEAVVNAFEYVKAQTNDFVQRRHRIEHCAECSSSLLERIKYLGLTVVTHPSFAYYSGDRYLATVEPDIIPYLYPIKSLSDSGLVIAGASDSPVVPANPIMGFYGGMTRTTSSGQKLSPRQRVNAREVLSFYTLNAAYASHEEQIKGSISPGKLADMVLLSDNPTTIPPEEVKNIKVEMTVISGEVVWRK